MNFRVTLALLIVLAVLGGTALWTERPPDATPTPTPAGERIFNFEAKDVADLTVSWAGKDVLFRKKPDGQWQIAQPELADAASGTIDQALYLVGRLNSSRDIVAKSSELASYGLDQPRGSVAVTMLSGDKQRLIIGGANPNNTAYYARRPVGDDTVVVRVVPSGLADLVQGLVEQPPKATPVAAPAATPSPAPQNPAGPIATPATGALPMITPLSGR